MNSFIENVNYLASLDSNYGDGVVLSKSNLSLRNVANDVTLKFSYFNYNTRQIETVTKGVQGMLYTGLETVLQEFVAQIEATLGGNKFDASYTISSANTGFLIHEFSITINSLDEKLKCTEINFNTKITSTQVEIYNLYGDVINPLKLLAVLALLDTDVLSGLNTLGENIDDIAVVANNIDDVIVVSDSVTNVNTVGNNISSVNITGSNISNINNVGSSIASLNTVSTNINSVNNVSSISDDVVIASGISDDISAVALIDDSVVVVSNNINSVNTVSSNIDNVNIVGTDIVNVNKVANVDNDVSALAPYALDIETVSDNIANVNTSGSNINSINIVSSNIDSIVTDANNIGDIIVIANDLSLQGFENVVDAGSITEAISSESTGISLIKTVADNIDEVLAAGSNIAAIIGVNANETNINSIVSDIIPNMAEILLSDNNAAIATTKASEASASEALAHKWADNPEDIPVIGTIGVDEEYSAYHWAKKAEAAIGGNITFDSLYDVDTTGVLDGGTIVWSQSLGKWVDYDFAHNDKLAFDLTAGVTVATGELAWNATEGTADLGLPGGSTLQIGQENVRTVRNATASTISNGRLCMFDGTIGNSGRIKVKPFTAGFNEAMYLYGVATQNITSGSDGIITIEGKVRGINTTGSVFGEVWADEDILYAKPNDNGAMTNVEPEDNQLKLVVATVIHAHATNGCLEIRFMPFNENMYYTKAQNDILLNSKVPLSGDFTLDLGGL